MCCTGASQKPSEVIAAIQSRRADTKIIPTPIPTDAKVEHFSIPKEIKEQLIRQQQLARIPQKTG